MLKIRQKEEGHKYLGFKMWTTAIILIALVVFNFPTIYNTSSDWIHDKAGFSVGHVDFDAFRLGLDLVGGAHLVYEVDTRPALDYGNVEDAVEGVRDVIERRVNAFGVGEPLVQTNLVGDAHRIIVELPGVHDVKAAIAAIGETPLLEFKEAGEEEQEPLTEEEQAQMVEKNLKAKATADEVITKVRAGEDFAVLAKKYSDDLISKENGGQLPLLNEVNAEGLEILDWAKTHTKGQYTWNYEEYDSGFYVFKHNGIEQGATEVTASHILVCYEGAEHCQLSLSKQEAFDKINEIKTQATVENFAALAAIHSTDGSSVEGGLLGTFGRGQMVPEFDQAVFDMQVNTISEPIETAFGYHLILKTDEVLGDQYNLQQIVIRKYTEADFRPPSGEWKNTKLSGAHLVRAVVQFDQNTGVPRVGLQFNDEGKDLFAEITKRNLQQPVAIFLDGMPISIPTVQTEITNGEAIITGNFTIQEAKLLVQRLNAGALPLPVELVSEQRVGASLGAESLDRSLKAALIGLLIVSIFIILYYRLFGFMAFLALVLYSAIVLAIFKSIPVTLTVSGLAGFILSLGIAVDANIIIFERVKEELWDGRRLHSAIEEGFVRAWAAIRDANVSTLITCAILFWFGSSVVKGFALTLSIGVIVSMISAIFITRLFLRFVIPHLGEETKLVLGNKRKPETETQVENQA